MTGSSPHTPFRYDPFDPAIQAEPYPTYQVLRDDHPVYWSHASHSWVLSRHADVGAALDDPGTFSSASGIYPTPRGIDLTQLFLPMMIMTDPPRHSQLRALVSRAFTPRRIARLEAGVDTLANQLLDDATTGTGCDIVTEVAGPLPAMVIADLLGVPGEDRHQFREWSTALVQARPDEQPGGPGMSAAAALYSYFGAFLDQRRREPEDDLLSDLVEARVDGQQLSQDELLGFCLLLLVAGHETTSNLISNGTVVLAHHPAARERLVADPTLIPQAVEELLRFDSPVQGLSRTLTRNITLHGMPLAEGDNVLLLYGAANRDERAFPNPDTFDIDRPVDNQLAFGHGIHFCLGAALARLEARIAFTGLLQRIPQWDVDLTNATRLTSGPIRGYASLPITW